MIYIHTTNQKPSVRPNALLAGALQTRGQAYLEKAWIRIQVRILKSIRSDLNPGCFSNVRYGNWYLSWLIFVLLR